MLIKDVPVWCSLGAEVERMLKVFKERDERWKLLQLGSLIRNRLAATLWNFNEFVQVWSYCCKVWEHSEAQWSFDGEILKMVSFWFTIVTVWIYGEVSFGTLFNDERGDSLSCGRRFKRNKILKMTTKCLLFENLPNRALSLWSIKICWKRIAATWSKATPRNIFSSLKKSHNLENLAISLPAPKNHSRTHPLVSNQTNSQKFCSTGCIVAKAFDRTLASQPQDAHLLV